MELSREDGVRNRICKLPKYKKKLGADEITLGDRKDGGRQWESRYSSRAGGRKGAFKNDKNWSKRQEEN